MTHALDDLRGWSFWRPWPSAILAREAIAPDLEHHLAKRCENRSAPPPRSMLGRYFAVHAGKKYSVGDWPWPGGIAIPSESECPIGIVGVARIVGWLDMRPELVMPREVQLEEVTGLVASSEAHTRRHRVRFLHRDPWFVGPVGVLLDDVTPIDPVPCKGALGFWRVPVAVAAIVRERWEATRG